MLSSLQKQSREQVLMFTVVKCCPLVVVFYWQIIWLMLDELVYEIAKASLLFFWLVIFLKSFVSPINSPVPICILFLTASSKLENTTYLKFMDQHFGPTNFIYIVFFLPLVILKFVNIKKMMVPICCPSHAYSSCYFSSAF